MLKRKDLQKEISEFVKKYNLENVTIRKLLTEWEKIKR